METHLDIDSDSTASFAEEAGNMGEETFQPIISPESTEAALGDQAVLESDGVSMHAGFPNPATDRRKNGIKLSLDFNQLLIRHPSSTFVFRIVGHRFVDHGIFDGDVAVIDRAVVPKFRDIIIRWQEQGFELKRYGQLEDKNEAWGIVTAIIHQYDRS